MAIDVTDANWEQEVIEASKTKPVLVDLWAEWCTPCLAFSPIIENVEKEMGDKVKFTKLDTDSNVATREKYNVMAIPTVLVFKDGDVTPLYNRAGVKSEGQLKILLNAVLAGESADQLANY